jgi:hypothetical protein
LHRKYGPLVRIAPNTVSVSNPGAINTIYGIGTKFSKSPFYNLAHTYDEQGLIPDPFILTDKVLHARMKKNAANAYSMNHLSRMESWIEPVTERLFRILDDQAGDTKWLDMAPVLRNYAMDVVFAITFGDDNDYLNNGDADGFLRILELATKYMAIVSLPLILFCLCLVVTIAVAARPGSLDPPIAAWESVCNSFRIWKLYPRSRLSLTGATAHRGGP